MLEKRHCLCGYWKLSKKKNELPLTAGLGTCSLVPTLSHLSICCLGKRHSHEIRDQAPSLLKIQLISGRREVEPGEEAIQKVLHVVTKP